MCSRCTHQCDAPAGINMDDTTVPICEVIQDGVNATGIAGITLETFKLMSGCYRTSNKSIEILERYQEEACTGGSNDGRYCAEDYAGPGEDFYLPVAYLTAVRYGTSKVHVAFSTKRLQTIVSSRPCLKPTR